MVLFTVFVCLAFFMVFGLPWLEVFISNHPHFRKKRRLKLFAKVEQCQKKITAAKRALTMKSGPGVRHAHTSLDNAAARLAKAEAYLYRDELLSCETSLAMAQEELARAYGCIRMQEAVLNQK